MIIEITDDGNGAWNFTAKTAKDAWPPLYMAYGRSTWAIGALVRGTLTDWDADSADTVRPQGCETAPGVVPLGVETSKPAETISGGESRILQLLEGAADELREDV